MASKVTNKETNKGSTNQFATPDAPRLFYYDKECITLFCFQTGIRHSQFKKSALGPVQPM